MLSQFKIWGKIMYSNCIEFFLEGINGYCSESQKIVSNNTNLLY